MLISDMTLETGSVAMRLWLLFVLFYLRRGYKYLEQVEVKKLC